MSYKDKIFALKNKGCPLPANSHFATYPQVTQRLSDQATTPNLYIIPFPPRYQRFDNLQTYGTLLPTPEKGPAMAKITLYLINTKLNALHDALEASGIAFPSWPAGTTRRRAARQMTPTAKQLLTWLESKAPLRGTANELHAQYPVKIPPRAFATTLGTLRARNDIPGFIRRQPPERGIPAVWIIEKKPSPQAT